MKGILSTGIRRWLSPRTFFLCIASVTAGFLLQFVAGLHPVWWLAWIAPALLLLLALRTSGTESRWIVLIASGIGVAPNLRHLLLVMPTALAALACLGQAALWAGVTLGASRIMRRHLVWWSAFAYPVLWVAADTLRAQFLPDGDWGSIGYTQADFLPVLQVAALFGVPGIVFLVTASASTLAVLGSGLAPIRRYAAATIVTITFLAVALTYGSMRLTASTPGASQHFGLASIDDAITPRTPASDAMRIRDRYDNLILSLAAGGASTILLPEKIAILEPAAAQAWRDHFKTMAREAQAWIIVGMVQTDGQMPVNEAWAFSPDGAVPLRYEKHYLAPPERRAHYRTARNFTTFTAGPSLNGIAICKDMHFAALGLDYARRQVNVMLVPALDFAYLDAWMASRISLTRGVEGGYAIVRSAREGQLTVSDAFGRILAEQRSAAFPGNAVLGDLQLQPVTPTLYSRSGNILGWVCVALSVLLMVQSQRRRKPADL